MHTLAPQWLRGCRLRACWFEPTFHKHVGKLCAGVQIHVEDPSYDHDAFRPWRLQALAFKALRQLQPDYPLWRDFPYEYEHDRLAIDVINGSPLLREWVDDASATRGRSRSCGEQGRARLAAGTRAVLLVLIGPKSDPPPIGRFRGRNPTPLMEASQIPSVWSRYGRVIGAAALLLFASVLLGACGGGGDGSGTPPVPPGMIGAAGGTVTGPGGAQAMIPAGALTQNTAIAIAQSSTGAPPLPAGVVTYGPMLAFTPHGTSFQSAVTITVPFDPAAVPAGATPVLYKTNAAMNGWDAVAGATISGSTMSASITGFSYLVVVSPPPLVLSNVKRYWSFDEYYADGSVRNVNRGHLHGFQVLDESQASGDLVFAPEDLA